MCPPTSLSLSPSVSWNITVGQKSPHWRLQGCIMRINELEVNMQAVCCLPLYTTWPIGFHQKLRWIVLPKAYNNTAQCFIYLKQNSKVFSKNSTCAFIPIWDICLYAFIPVTVIYFKGVKWWWSNTLNCIWSVISHLHKQTVNMCFLSQWRGLCVAVVVYWCVSPTSSVAPPPASWNTVGGFIICTTGCTDMSSISPKR